MSLALKAIEEMDKIVKRALDNMIIEEDFDINNFEKYLENSMETYLREDYETVFQMWARNAGNEDEYQELLMDIMLDRFETSDHRKEDMEDLLRVHKYMKDQLQDKTATEVAQEINNQIIHKTEANELHVRAEERLDIVTSINLAPKLFED